MDTPADDRTRATLLARLRAADGSAEWNAAWERFFARYHGLIRAWCAGKGLSDADADEVVSRVLLVLSRRMAEFDYDPSRRFRGWLHTVVVNEVRGHLGRRNSRPGDYGRGGEDPQPETPDPAAEADQLAEAIDGQREVLRLALDRVRARVEARTWDVFRRTAIDGDDAAAVAEATGMSVLAVYKAKSRTLDLLRVEVRALLPD